MLSLKKRRLGRDVIAVLKHMKGCHSTEAVDLFSIENITIHSTESVDLLSIAPQGKTRRKKNRSFLERDTDMT